LNFQHSQAEIPILFIGIRVSFLSNQELSELVSFRKCLFNYPSQLIDKWFGRSSNGLSSMLTFRDHWKRLLVANSKSELFTVKSPVAGHVFSLGNIF